ncbi:MAG: hypothetical protein JWQ09_4239 [Segetibacter sp.]|nr:hypothetical protein [Segetibacter sp.]
MKKRYLLFPLLAISLFLISATSIEKKENTMAGEPQLITATPMTVNKVVHKQNFFQRLMVKLFVRKNEQVDKSKADNLASTSLFLGIGACALLLLGAVVPLMAFASIPLGIAAIVTGGSAIKQGTSEEAKAKTGKGLGIGALITMTVLLILGAIILASWNMNWN